MNIIRETFASDSDFIAALDKACAIIVNMKKGNCLPAKAPELVNFIGNFFQNFPYQLSFI